DHQQARTVGKPRQKVVGEPVPGLVAHRLARGLGAALERIVDHANIKRLAGHSAAYGRVAEVALAADELDDLAVLQHAVALEDRPAKRLEIFLAAAQALDAQVGARAKAVGERREDDLGVAILAGNPGQKVDNAKALAMLRRRLQQELGS